MGLLNKLKAVGGASAIIFSPEAAQYAMSYVDKYVPQGSFLGLDNCGIAQIGLTAIVVVAGLALLYDL
jgi:hypothetical protein